MTHPAAPKGEKITAEMARELFSYDPETGILRWKVSRPGRKAGAEAGTHTYGYIQVEVNYRFYRAHRIIWLMQTGEWPAHQIDHINGIRDDNRWSNLREATPMQNSRNRRPSKRNKSGIVGVSWNRQRRGWDACIGHRNRTVNLGCFPEKKDAVAARCEAEKHYFGEFAYDWQASQSEAREAAE